MPILLRAAVVFLMSSLVVCKVCDLACEEHRANQALRKRISVLGEQLLTCLSKVPSTSDKPLTVGHGLSPDIMKDDPHSHLVQLSLMKQLCSLIEEMKNDIRQCEDLVRRQAGRSGNGKDRPGSPDMSPDISDQRIFRKTAKLGTKLIREIYDENTSSKDWKTSGNGNDSAHATAIHVKPGVSRKISQLGNEKTRKKLREQLVRQRFQSLLSNKPEKPKSRIFYG